MGSNMQRQAVPLIRAEAPLVGTGMDTAPRSTPVTYVVAKAAGVVTEVGRLHRGHGGRRPLRDLPARQVHALQPGHLRQPAPVRHRGRPGRGRSPIADGPSTDSAEMALGRNLLVAYMPWEGHNYEDAIILSQRLVQEDVLTSIHIEEHEVDARDTKQARRDIPAASRRDAQRARHHPHRRGACRATS